MSRRALEMPSLPAQSSTLRTALMQHRTYLDRVVTVSERLGAWITAAQFAVAQHGLQLRLLRHESRAEVVPRHDVLDRVETELDELRRLLRDPRLRHEGLTRRPRVTGDVPRSLQAGQNMARHHPERR